MADDVDASAPFVPVEQRHDRKRSRRDARSRANFVERIFVEGLGCYGRVPRAARIDTERHEVLMSFIPMSEIFQIVKRFGEKASADQQQERERDLCGNENFSCARRPACR